MCDEPVDDVGDVAFHDSIELVQGETDAVIGEAILRKIVSADFFTAVASAYLGLAVLGNGIALLFECNVIKAGSKHAQGLGLVLDLRLLGLARDD